MYKIIYILFPILFLSCKSDAQLSMERGIKLYDWNKLDDAIVECDFMTSFTNNRGNNSRWQMNFGAEVNRFPDYPIRFGFMINNVGTGISIGSGIHKKRINYDYAFSLYDGVTLSTAKGLKFAMGISWR